MNLDDQLYDIVAKEIRSGTLVDGLYTRAFAEANGDKDKAQAKYIKLRVAQLRQEVKDRAEQQQAKAKAEAKAREVRSKESADNKTTTLNTSVFDDLVLIVLIVIVTLIVLGAVSYATS